MIFFAVVFVACVIYLLITRKNDFWKKNNVISLELHLFFGNMKPTIFLKKSLGEHYRDMYDSKVDVPYVGFFKVTSPALLVKDLELVKRILVKDFNSFSDNDFQVDEKIDPMMGKSPFVLKNPKWKIVRNQLTPTLTSGKVKIFVPLMENISNVMVEYLKNNLQAVSDEGIDCKEIMAKYTTEVISACLFGLEANTFTDVKSEFREVGRKRVNSWLSAGVITQLITSPRPDFRYISKNTESWFRRVIGETVKYRDDNNLERNDFLQFLMDLRKKSHSYEFTQDDIIGHCVLFFTDGFESSTITLSFALYELSRNIHIQNRLRDEIQDTLKKHSGNLSYEAVQEMTYLDQVISETLRKYPPIMYINRLCTKEWILPPNVKINVGASVVISILGIHYDSNIYPDPDRFCPDRFSNENSVGRNKYAYLPFGEGLRICLGICLALLQIKVGLIAILNNFEVRKCRTTPEKFKLEPVFFLKPKEEINLNFFTVDRKSYI